jgi:tetratricopeptide (TPR) repeat protein
VRVYLRNDDWFSNHNLWVRTVQYSWNSHNAWNNIGDDYDKLGQMDNAIKGFGRSYEWKNNYADAYHNQANILFKIKRYDLARWGYETALAYSPALYQSYISLTQVALNQGDRQGAFNYAQKLVKAQPNNPQAYYVLGVVYVQIGDRENAIKFLNMALQLDPQYKPALEILKQIQK